MQINEIAVVAHEANRAMQALQGDPAPSPAWDDAPQWQRDSAIEGVLKAQAGATHEELHNEWCVFKTATGWVYGPVKDDEAKTHPCLVPYADLPVGQQDKDKLFSAIVAALS